MGRYQRGESSKHLIYEIIRAQESVLKYSDMSSLLFKALKTASALTSVSVSDLMDTKARKIVSSQQDQEDLHYNRYTAAHVQRSLHQSRELNKSLANLFKLS